MNNKHRERSFLPGHTNDPIEKENRETPSFNRAWLKNGESLTILQRCGFAIFSLLSVAMGLYLARFAVMFARSADFDAVIFCPVSLGFLAFGILGLQNVLRFGKGPAGR